ncbi:hypothetical protein TRFO_12727 [Tritrichomonas foetus]|uniref:DUF1152 domain-containing protein n=1 Tax=Tritrichomonas foetus TaxID=1144522 RepID=A0A1J4L4W7_9EUKA|nr:hypothetical protein TRFO_12727 [Tritrichomonas foetus]|eukprot:OHT17028.1 hypothetical protein TRFO_12727 [Tritrichomonas foetus]
MEDILPKWISILSDDSVQNILLTGCGGGFDFTNALLMIPFIFKMKKKLIIVSNSFSTINSTYKDYETVFSNETRALAKKIVPGKDKPNSGYMPEKIFIDIINQHFPENDMELYATEAHYMPAPTATEFLKKLCQEKSIDCVITIDGGSDSLMKGDEYEIATIAEDFISLVTVQNLMHDKSLNIKYGILIAVGIGADRVHGASDASSLRAIAELTRMGGFLGSNSINQDSLGFKMYSELLLESKKHFQSIVGSFIAAAAVGQFGPAYPDIRPVKVPRNFERSGVPEECITLFNLDEEGNEHDEINNNRADKSSTYIWPIMAQFYAFDVNVVLERCLLGEDAKGRFGYQDTLRRKLELSDRILSPESFPTFDFD